MVRFLMRCSGFMPRIGHTVTKLGIGADSTASAEVVARGISFGGHLASGMWGVRRVYADEGVPNWVLRELI